jgi:hypothetical protein
MQSLRIMAPWLRLALAGLFAIASLIQVPSMALARSSAAAHSGTTPLGMVHHDMGAHAEHGMTHADHRDHAQASLDRDGVAACCSFNCCTLLTPISNQNPHAVFLLLGKMEASPSRTMVPALPDPADPPPRLPV